MPEIANLRSALLALCVVFVGLAINEVNGALSPDAIFDLEVAGAAALLALALPPRETGRRTPSWLSVLLLAGVAYEAGYLATTMPGIYMRVPPDALRTFARGVAAAAVAGGGAILASGWARRVAILGLVALHGALGIWMIHASPEPHIDVYYFQRDACAALLHGKNPYAITFANIYGDASAYYGPGLAKAGRLQFGFVYPPLSLLLALPGHLLGDVRYSQVCAIELAAGMMAFARESAAGAAAAALFLLTPRAFFIIEQNWTEPFAVMLLAATVFAACRARRALPYALGLFFAVKQTMIIAVLPSLFLLPSTSLRAAADFALRVAATTAAVTLPFVLWNVHAFWFDVVQLQTLQPFRADALSFLAWLSRNRPAPLPTWISFAAAGLVTALAWVRLPRTPAGFAAAVGLALMAFFAFNKQAFANYYYFVIGALCCAIAAQSQRPAAMRAA